MRKIWALVICAVLALTGVGALGEVMDGMPEGWMGEFAEYEGGGVIWRASEKPKTRALVSELDVAYLDFDMPYLIRGERAEWTLVAAGGDGVYEYEFGLYHRAGTVGELTRVNFQRRSSANAFAADITRIGHYMLLVTVYDTNGKSLGWQSQIFESFERSAENDITTVPGKVKALARECVSQVGDNQYARALWLHDYLIYNANYDYNYENYYADGVLLLGTGVCQSYALAYDMLLKEVGIECIYVSGYAGERHGWNIVKLDGEWYHIDTTWDDPGSGGYENHSYFAITDAQMARDHSWADDKGVMPECVDVTNGHIARVGYTPVRGTDELNAALDALLAARGGYQAFAYVGADRDYEIGARINDWINAHAGDFGAARVDYVGSEYGAYIRINYESADMPPVVAPLSLAADSSKYVISLGEAVTPMLFALPEYITRITVTQHDGYSTTTYESVPLDLNEFDLIWRSSDESIVEVQNGRLISVACGRASVTIECEGGAMCAFDVEVRMGAGGLIEIPYGVTSIEDEAFMNCVTLYEVELPDTLTRIGASAFAGCAALETIWIPASVTDIAPDTFEGCEFIVIHCPYESYAYEYALDNNIPVDTGE